VVVDDGSDDNTVLESVAGYPTVTLIRQEPLGRSAARNRGAAATDSDFLLFLDADDLLRPEALQVMGAALDADPALEMVHGRVFEFVDRRYPPPPGVRNRDAELSLRLGGSTLLRRSLWRRVGEMDERLPRGEWIDWISRADHNGATVAHIGDIVLERRLHAFNSTTPGDDNRHYLSVIRAAILRKRLETDS
jgi:glycosyltransferase involved in cell wall biosynthesis